MIETSQRKEISVATINCRGIRREHKLKQLVSDITRYKIQIAAIQETHLRGTGLFQIFDDNNVYDFFFTGASDNRYHGVGIVAAKSLKAQFQRISDRICTMTTHVNRKKMVVISAYAPTSAASKKDPGIRETFYETLDGAVSKESKGTLET